MPVLPRQKITEREFLNDSDMRKLLKKSNGRCSHCGKKIFAGYNATTDHFVPLSQGGTNRDINLIALCRDCNKEKSNLIFRPRDYLTYLSDEELDKIDDYFDSFVRSFEFVHHGNLLACDAYKLFLSYADERMARGMRKRYKNVDAILKKCSTVVWLKRATQKEHDAILEYYIKCLKKYGHYASDDAAMINIDFWMSFGCIYYVAVGDEIKSIVAVSLTKDPVTAGFELSNYSSYFHLTIDMFSYYASDMALNLMSMLMQHIPAALAQEQNLIQLPMRIRCFDNDPIKCLLRMDANTFVSAPFYNAVTCGTFGAKKFPPIREDATLNTFFGKFKPISRAEAKNWISKRGDPKDYGWLLDEIEIEIDGEFDERNRRKS